MKKLPANMINKKLWKLKFYEGKYLLNTYTNTSENE